MRLIDADANIETMKKCAENPESEQALLCYRYTQRILEEAPTVPAAYPWHRVEDEMPPDGKWVLVCNDEGKMLVAKYESEVPQWYYKYINYDWDVWDDEEQGPVCYWMPIEPPKEENK